jgi:hypothetical protein
MDNNPQKSRYEALLDTLEREFAEIFPKGKLRNRLHNLGLKEFLEDGAIDKYGFPFRYLSHLDEAIITLAYYLHRFKKDGGTLRIYGLHRLPKGEDKSLSPWASEKAKLYLEIQHMILLLDGVAGRKSSIRRIFSFRDISDIAFLTQSAISVISEQRSAKIDIGFIFTETFRSSSPIDPISNMVIVDYEPASPGKIRPNFYELYDLPNQGEVYNLPYQQRFSAKWYRSRADATREIPGEENKRARRLNALLELFESGWEDFMRGNFDTVYQFPKIGSEFFNSALVMMYTAFARAKDLPPSYTADQVIDRFNERVVTPSLVRLERAMSAFDEPRADTIRAVDSSSVKDTLTVHESEPTYRHWLRRSLNRILKKKSETHLERIYIFDDSKPQRSVEDEYASLTRNMQYYFDYFHYEISEIAEVVNHHKKPEEIEIPQWAHDSWESLKGRVRIYITTKSNLQAFSEQALDEETRKILREFSSDDLREANEAWQSLVKLDYLYTDDMIYAFDNPRADPGELNFTAYLLRKSFDVEREEDILFEFARSRELRPLALRQKLHRMKMLVESIEEYAEAYKEVDELKEQLNQYRKEGEEIKSKLAEWRARRKQYGSESNEVLDYFSRVSEFHEVPKRLIKIRYEIEAMLHEYFAPRVSHLFELLKCLSVRVEFFEDIKEKSIKNVYPFNLPESTPRLPASKKMQNEIKRRIDERLKIDPDYFPRFQVEKVATAEPKDAPVPPRPSPTGGKQMIKILFLAATPEDEVKLNVEEEAREVNYRIRLGARGDRFKLEKEFAVRTSDLTDHLLNYKPTIVHFSGHGSEYNEIILLDNNGRGKPVSGKALKRLFNALKDNIRCVVLNACYSEWQAQAIAEHIDCVIGMSDSISDQAAINFSSAFYGALAFGRDVKTAFEVGLSEIAIDLDSLGEEDIPKLLSSPDCDPSHVFLVDVDEA